MVGIIMMMMLIMIHLLTARSHQNKTRIEHVCAMLRAHQKEPSVMTSAVQQSSRRISAGGVTPNGTHFTSGSDSARTNAMIPGGTHISGGIDAKKMKCALNVSID